MARRREGCRLRKEEARVWGRKPLSRLAAPQRCQESGGRPSPLLTADLRWFFLEIIGQEANKNSPAVRVFPCHVSL